MLEDGRFAFLMWKMDEDLESLIKRRMHGVGHDHGPFSKEESEECMYQVALGVLWLHEYDIVHRDLKAANVLMNKARVYVADFECSIGVVGTRYWRAPEILKACKDYTVSQKPELFTKAGDIYNYAMVCYEILSGKHPFENQEVTMDLVIEGQRPILPTYIDEWVCILLHRCWEYNPEGRPSIQEILSTIAANTSIKWIKEMDVIRKNTRVTDVQGLQLGCGNSSHTFERMECVPCESGDHICKLCFKTCDEDVYKSLSCMDCSFHPTCGGNESVHMSFDHPHILQLRLLYNRNGQDKFCDGCRLEIGDEYWYECTTPNCKYELHILCAKYVGRISHPIHEEHELELSTLLSIPNENCSMITCGSYKQLLDSKEFIYHCEECGFKIHPKWVIRLEMHKY